MILSEEERQAAQAKLEEVRAAQTEFWDALFELEELTGLRLCSDVDFEDHELDALEEASEEVQHRS